jgi:hypothetical protein
VTEVQGAALDVIWERWARWSGEREAVLRRWQDAVAQLAAATQAAQRHALAAERELAAASGGLSARQRAAAERHTHAGSRPRSRLARAALSTWTYHAARSRAARARWEAIGASDAAALERAGSALAQATRVLLDTYGTHAAEVTGQTRRRLNALASAERRS